MARFPHLTYATQVGAGAATLVAAAATIHAVVLSGDGTNAATVTIRDGGAGGTTVLAFAAAATSSTNIHLGDGYVPCATDVHATVTGAGSVVTILYAELN